MKTGTRSRFRKLAHFWSGSACACIVGMVLMPAVPAEAAASRHGTGYIFAVTTTTDQHDAHPGDGICADPAGSCTLRGAVEEASAEPAGSSVTIAVPGGGYRLPLGSLEPTANTVTVSGAGANASVVEASAGHRVFVVGARARVSIVGLTITGGTPGAEAYGGGVLNEGGLSVVNSVITGNVATAGGGIANSGGHLDVVDSVISHNRALYYGGGGIQNGGLHNLAGRVSVVASTIEDNSAGGDGGGILNGQNGHPAAEGLAAEAVHPWCPPIARCAGRADDLTLGQAPSGPDRARGGASALPLELSVSLSTIAGNRNGNGGGGISMDGGTAVLVHDVISNNNGAPSGGGIFSSGDTSVIDSTVTANQGGYGGGIEAINMAGSMTVADSTIDGNTAQYYGGGMDISAAQATITGSTIADNVAGGGGGIMLEGSSSMAIENSTLSGNAAQQGGGGIQTFACSSVTVAYVTLSGNSKALALSCPDVTLIGTIIATSTRGPNCIGSLPHSLGYNLDSGTTCGLGRPTDMQSTDPLLRPLAFNGGPTQTEALARRSLAVDHGGNRSTGCPVVDQRGDPRPWGPACDIGAYELEYR